jgi:hypothetical protein
VNLRKELEIKQAKLTVQRLKAYLQTIEQDYEVQLLACQIKMDDMTKELEEKRTKATSDLAINEQKLKDLLKEEK